MTESEVVKVQLTKRDVEILRFINDFGFVVVPQIEKRFSIKFYIVYRLLTRLLSEGLINYKKIFHLQHGVYYLSAKGAQVTDLPPIDKIPIGYYEHQLSVTNVYLKLQQQFPDALWISERRLKHDKYYEGVGKRGHLADGMLVFSDGKQIAIEVEMSVKGKNRLEKILKSYATQFSIKEVWYYCSPSVIPTLTALSAKMPFVKIYNLLEFLA